MLEAQACKGGLQRDKYAQILPPSPAPASPVPHTMSLLSQGDLQEKAQKHQRLQDRSSLLSEVQALRAQLRLTHLQNQEKLQQLCAALTSAEARGSQREHQLRRQGGCHCSSCLVPPTSRPPLGVLLWGMGQWQLGPQPECWGLMGHPGCRTLLL